MRSPDPNRPDAGFGRLRGHSGTTAGVKQAIVP